MLSFEPDLDFLGLRLLTPLRPMFSPCFLKSSNDRLKFLPWLFRTLKTIELAGRELIHSRWSGLYICYLQNWMPIDLQMYSWPRLIVQQTLPLRIHHPGSVCLRHLGELSPTISFCHNLDENGEMPLGAHPWQNRGCAEVSSVECDRNA